MPLSRAAVCLDCEFLVLRPAVLAFALLMERALQAHDDTGGWEAEPDRSLLRRMQREVNALAEAVRDRRTTIGAEAVEVANCCLMIAENWGYLV